MASTINAKNTTAGVVISPDTSGQLELQTVDVTRLAVTSSGNIGIGTTGPGSLLEVYGGSLGTTSGNSSELARFTNLVSNGSNLRIYQYRNANGTDWTTASTRIQQRIDVTDQAFIEFNPLNGTYGLALGTNNIERVRITSNGGVAFGGASNFGSSGQVLESNGDGPPSWITKGQVYRTRVLTSGTTYTTPSDVEALYVFVFGATGGRSGVSGGMGGPGYSETYYASPAASYTYSIGAAGTNTGTAGGTTTFGAMSVTGSAGVTTTTGGTGGVGSGGTFNATGGSGGNGNGTTSGGGTGGAGSRAGNGGNAGNAAGSVGGGGGGTGGNNASANLGGAAATSKAAGALTLPFVFLNEFFSAGSNNGGTAGGNGASTLSTFDTNSPGAGVPTPTNVLTSANMGTVSIVASLPTTVVGSANGNAGRIMVIEVLK